MERDPTISPPPGKVTIQRWLQLHVAEVVQRSVDEIDVELPFSHYGLDSIAALGISAELEIWLGRRLSPTLTWDYPNIERLSAFLAQDE